MYFGKDGGYTLREFKKWYKLEMEENPERYTHLLPEDYVDQSSKREQE